MPTKRGTLIRVVYLAIAGLWWLCTGLGRLGRGAAVVLCYHGVTPEQRERFRWQMQHIARWAVEVEQLRPGVPAIRWGRPRVCVTFDDAFACLLENALPITAGLQIPTTVFAVSGNLGKPPAWVMSVGHPERELRTMTLAQLQEVAQGSLCRIGSHTARHVRLNEVSAAGQQAELVESRTQLEEGLGRPVEDLALPHGAYDERVWRAARAAGYRRIFTLEPCCHPGPLAEGLVGRFSVSPETWRLEFVLVAAGAYAWLRHWRILLGRVGVRRGPRTAAIAAGRVASPQSQGADGR